MSQQQQQQPSQSSAPRGSGRSSGYHSSGRGSPSGGRTPQSGRRLVDPNNRRPQSHTVHQGSGIPHGFVPAYLPGSSSFVEELDQRLLIVLRDGKHIVGTLCSYDQFSNLILRDAAERRLVRTTDNKTYFHDVPLGLYVVRGDNMVLTGQLDAAMEAHSLQQVSLEELEWIAEKSTTKPELEWDFDTDLIA